MSHLTAHIPILDDHARLPWRFFGLAKTLESQL